MNELIKEFNRENLKPIVFILIVLILTAITAYPQSRFGGTVVDVVDGKTAVIEVSMRGRINVVLQFIEVPEAEQPLSQMVKQHLSSLILGKTVEFVPKRILQTGSYGQVFLGDVDVSQQMLRDGAAWYNLPEKAGQDSAGSEVYLSTEAQAKAEKRGVWSIADLKTAWEFRAEKEEIRKREEQAKLRASMPQAAETKTATVVKPKKKQFQDVDMWSNVGDTSNATEVPNVAGLLSGTVPQYGFTYVSTTSGLFKSIDEDSNVKVESRSVYIHSAQQENNGYVIGFLTESEEYMFAEQNSLTIVADKQKINLGKALRFSRQLPNAVQELLVYKIDQKTLSKLAAAKDISITLGKYQGKTADDYLTRIKNLVTAMTD
jgi:endonuclease YncB( thermonuclease family)